MKQNNTNKITWHVGANPVEAGIVEKPEDYLYSSARDYYGMKGLIDIIMVDPMAQGYA